MIIPFLKGFLHYLKAPLTWTLVALNLLIFLMTWELETRQQGLLEKKFLSQGQLMSLGIYYQQYLRSNDSKSAKLDLKQSPIAQQRQRYFLVLGAQALRDAKFVRDVQEFQFSGDPVEVRKFKESINGYKNILDARSANIFGLSQVSNTWLQWITYQFMHGGFMHLLSNMVVLLIFGGIIEETVGSFIFLTVYLLCGVLAGFSYLILSDAGLSPVVGASGAISGLMTFYAITESRRNVRYFYFFAPSFSHERGAGDGFGFIYLPTWLMIPLSFLPDLAAYVVTPAETGGSVAYTAHLGGALCGAALAGLYRLRSKYSHPLLEQSRDGAYSP